MTDLLNLPGIAVVEVRDVGTQYTITAEVTAHQPPHWCCLLSPTSTVKYGKPKVMFRDLPIHGKFVDIWIYRQKFKCKHCGAFMSEAIPGMHPDHNMTERLHRHLCEAPYKRTFASVAAEVGISEGTVRNVFNAHTTERLKDYSFETPRVIGFDEKHLLGSFRCVVGNIEERTLLDILANRYKQRLDEYLDAMADKERVEVVCQDMYANYRTMARKHFPHAEIVVDKFHVVKMANEAMENCRRRVNADMTKEDRVKLKNQRKLLLARYHKLPAQAQAKVDGWLAKYPRLDTAYWLKERFYDVYDADTVAEAEAAYQRWLLTLEKAPDYQTFFAPIPTAMKTWSKHIFAHFEHRYTSAYIEGVNRLLDDLQRAGRGYSFEVLRAKALLAYGHQKKALPQFVREQFDNRSTSMSREGWEALPKVNYGIDIDSLSRAIGTRNVVCRWNGVRYIEEDAPSGLSTLKVPDYGVV